FTGMPPTNGSAKLVMLGDRWLVEESRMQTDDGKTIDGRAFTGWDPAKQRYVRAWIETADSRLNVVDLTWDEGQMALISDALLMDLGQGLVSARGVTRMPDADTIVFTATPVAPDAIPGLAQISATSTPAQAAPTASARLHAARGARGRSESKRALRPRPTVSSAMK